MSLTRAGKIDKSVLDIGTLGKDSDDFEFWLTQSPEERLNAIEFLRQQFYDYDPVTTRLQRILEIADRK